MANIEKKDEFTIIWNDGKTVGLRFKEGESLQLYTKSIVIDSFDSLQNEKDLERLQSEVASLEEYAKVKYPMEFAEMS